MIPRVEIYPGSVQKLNNPAGARQL